MTWNALVNANTIPMHVTSFSPQILPSLISIEPVSIALVDSFPIEFEHVHSESSSPLVPSHTTIDKELNVYTRRKHWHERIQLVQERIQHVQT